MCSFVGQATDGGFQRESANWIVESGCWRSHVELMWRWTLEGDATINEPVTQLLNHAKARGVLWPPCVKALATAVPVAASNVVPTETTVALRYAGQHYSFESTPANFPKAVLARDLLEKTSGEHLWSPSLFQKAWLDLEYVATGSTSVRPSVDICERYKG